MNELSLPAVNSSSSRMRHNLRRVPMAVLSLLLSSQWASAQIVLSDDFDPGIDAAVWSQFGGTVEANTFGQAAGPGSTANSLWFNGDGSRFATTEPIDIRAGGTISFSFAMGGPDPDNAVWEDADPGEEVILEYSADGLAYIQIGGPYDSITWQSLTEILPAAAETSNTRFRFRQLSHSGSNFDHWAIDNLTITANGQPDLVVEESLVALTSNASILNFGSSLVAVEGSSKTFVIRNAGVADLLDLEAEVVGTNALDFVPDMANMTATVTPTGTTEITVTFTPSGVGPRNARLRIKSNDPDQPLFEVALEGVGTVPAIIVADGDGELSDGTAIVDFGEELPGVARPAETFTISNTGTGPLTNIEVMVVGNHPDDFVRNLAGMDTTVSPQGSTTFTVTFTPGALGGRSAILRILSNDLNNGQFDIQLTGDGIAADIAVSEAASNLTSGGAPRSYGIGLLDEPSAPKTFVISNVGSATLSVTNVELTGVNKDEYSFLEAVPPSNLESGESIEVKVIFTAGGLGVRDATLQITSNDPDESVFMVGLTGTGVGIPEIAVERDSGTPVYNGGAPIDFGIIGTGSSSTAVEFTIRNTGTDFLTGLTVDILGDHPAEFSRDVTNLAATLAPGASKTFSVSFNPTEIEGLQALLSIGSNDADENPFEIRLNGTGAAIEREIVVEQAGNRIQDELSSVYFGAVGYTENSERVFTIRNVGLTSLQISELSVIGDAADDFTITQDHAANLTIGNETMFTVKFDPLDRAVPGERVAQLLINNNDSDEDPFEIWLSGNIFHGFPDTLQHEIPAPPTGTQAAQLGWSVAASGDLVAMGAPEAAINGTRSGEVKVFRVSTGQMIHAIRCPGDVRTDSFFGKINQVGLSGSYLIVGDPYNSTGASRSGSAYVYDLGGVTPTVPLLTLDNPDPATDDFFASAVAISGNIVAVGAYKDDTAGSNRGAVYVYDIAGQTPETPVLTLADAAFGPSFGFRLAVDERRIVVCNTSSSGSAYVFDLDSPTPSEPIATLANTMSDSEYGSYAAISGDRVVIGSYGNGSGLQYNGRVFVYELGGVTPGTPVLVLDNPVPAQYAFFGDAVSISGSRLAVGSRGRVVGGVTYVGSTYVYDLDSATPSAPQWEIDNPDLGSGDYFGAAVAVLGGQLVVGAPGNDSFAGGAGIGFVFDLAGESPTVPIRELVHSSPSSGDAFGSSVAISRRMMVVGANSAGHASVFDLEGGVPTEPAFWLQPSGSTGGYGFGQSVSISGHIAVVGAPLESNFGRAYVYDLAAESPGLPILEIANPGLGSGDQFGCSVAVSGRLIVVGALYSDTGASNAGKAYVFDLDAASPTSPVAILENPNPSSGAGFGDCVAIHGTRVVVGARGYASYSGIAYVYDLAGVSPTTPLVTLNNPSPSSSAYFGSEVTISGTRIVVGASGERSSGNAGIAYVYDLRNESPEIPVQTLSNPELESVSSFGRGVSLVAGRLVVGAKKNYPSATNSGLAYLYDLDGVNPNEPLSILPNPSPAYGDSFGTAVATDGVRVAVGAPSESTVALNKGGAYVFSAAAPGPKIAVEQPAGIGLEHGISTLDFGNVAVGTSMPRVFTIRNVGGEDLTGIFATVVGGNSAEFSISPTPAISLLPGGSTTFTVGFMPTGGAGLRTTNLRITSNDPDIGTFEVELMGTGVLEPEIVVEEPVGAGLQSGVSFSDFGPVPVGEVSAGKVFTVRNSGTALLTGLMPSLNGVDSAEFSIDATGLPGALSPGASGSFVVTFSPTGFGARNTQLRIASNDTDESPFVVNLSGSGAGAPKLVVEYLDGPSLIPGTSVVEFGDVQREATSEVLAFMVRNSGNVDLNNLVVTLAGTDAADFTVDASAMPTLLAPRASSFFTVTMSPTAVGARNAELRIASNDPDDNPFIVSLTGSGLPTPEIAVRLSSNQEMQSRISRVSFGETFVGLRSTSRKFTVRNEGEAPLTGLDVTIIGNSADYQVEAAGLGGAIALGESATFTVTFVPTFIGFRNAVLRIASNDVDENPFEIQLEGAGGELSDFLEDAYVKASNTDGGDKFGHAVAVDGNTVVIGASREDSSASGVDGDQNDNSSLEAGAAYVFVRDAEGAWSQQAYLKGDDTETGDLFGHSVAISGDTIIVGAVGDNTDILSVGAVYVFVRDSAGDWSRQDRLLASNAGYADFFGFSIAIDGDIVVVGAPTEDGAASGVNGNGNDDSLQHAGAAYIYVRDATGIWTEDAYLKSSNPSAEVLFGEAVAVEGARVIVGTFREDSYDGAVYVFEPDPVNGWDQTARLTASNASGPEDLSFGASVAISGDFMVIGASTAGSVGGGAVYMFEWNSTNWVETDILEASNSGAGDKFGLSVDISGEMLIVGANEEDGGGSGINDAYDGNARSQSGAAYLFVRGGNGVWQEEAKLKAPNPGLGARYGNSVAISDGTVVVGAELESSNAIGVDGQASGSSIESGAAYIYVIDAPYIFPDIDVVANFAGVMESGVSMIDMGSHILGAGAIELFDISNSGDIPLTGISIEFAGTNPEDCDLTFPPDGELAVGASTSCMVQFSPKGIGSREVKIRILSNDPDENPFEITLVGVGLLALPEIIVEHPSGTGLTTAVSSVDFGRAVIGAGTTRSFSIRNVGGANLSVEAAYPWGGNASDFTVTSPPSNLIERNGSSDFTVSFSPSVAGIRTTTLRIVNNDPNGNEDPFEITLTGDGATAGDLMNSELLAAGLSGDDLGPHAIPFDDGVENILKYAFNMNLSGSDNSILTPDSGTSGLPTYALDDSGATTVVRVQYIRRTGSGLVYTPLKSGDLQTESFEPMNGTETSETLGGGFERVTVVAPCDPATEPSCFWRVRVTLP